LQYHRSGDAGFVEQARGHSHAFVPPFGENDRALQLACTAMKLPPEAHLCELFPQRPLDYRVDQVRDVAPQAGDLTNQAGTEKGEMQGRNQEHGFETLVQLAVHQRHLELVFEIADGAKTAYHEVGTDVSGKIDQQAVKRLDIDPILAGNDLREEGDALAEREERLLALDICHSDDQSIDEMEAPGNQIFMALRRRIEGPGIYRDSRHGQ
jgi:hypothetical protein